MTLQAVNKNDESPIRLNAREERARKNLERFIDESGYSVTQVADMAGIAQANLGRYVNGKSPIPIDALIPLAEVLGRDSIEDFFNPEPPKQKTKDELASAQPMFARARPGFEPTEEELAEIRETLQRIQSRREKKNKPKSSR